MSIMRLTKEERKSFLIMDSTIITNKALSKNARFVLIYLLSKPDDWELNIKFSHKELGMGSKAFYKALQELEKFKYLSKQRGRNKKGWLGEYDYKIFECPYGDNHVVEIPHAVNHHVETTTHNNDYSTNDYINKNNINNTMSICDAPLAQNSQNASQETIDSTPMSLDLQGNKNALAQSQEPLTVYSLEIYDHKIEITINTPKGHLGKSNALVLFDVFWELYPLKKGKGVCRDKFIKMFEMLNFEKASKLIWEMINGLTKQAEEWHLVERVRSEKPYWNIFHPSWPHANTWIHQKRWEDEYRTTYEEVYDEYYKQNQSKESSNPRTQTLVERLYGEGNTAEFYKPFEPRTEVAKREQEKLNRQREEERRIIAESFK